MPNKDAREVRVGQAVLDSAAVVKELVENSLDAGATRVDIFLKGKAGIDRVTVVDNGSGLRHEDYARLCVPHATSKVANLHDLDSVTTLGFRGEAMSAIAAMADSVTVTTKTEGEDVGCKLLYSPQGNLEKQSPAARKRGTTVQVDQLFARLPVRREDAIRHSSRDLNRCLSVAQAYALVASHVRFELRVESGTRLVTQPQPGSSRETESFAAIQAVLGRNVAGAMVPIRRDELLPAPSGSSGDKVDGYALFGFLSKTGSGGSGKQFIFLNKRPVDMPRLVRAVNESFRRSSTTAGNAAPAFVFFLDVPIGSFDVNLSPDKRAVMLHREAEVVSAVQQVVEEVWLPQDTQLIPVGVAEKADRKTVPASEPVQAPGVSLPRMFDLPGNSPQGGKQMKNAVAQRNAPPKTAKRPQPALLSSARTVALNPALTRTGSRRTSHRTPVPAVAAECDVSGVSPSRKVVGSLTYSFEEVCRKRARATMERTHAVAGMETVPCSDSASEEERETKRNKRVAFSSSANSEEVDTAKAERELSFSFDKSWFRELKVLGQFNRGFIICLFREADIFIVDQHAADEKFNYEDLEKTTTLETQALVKPLSLDLGVEDELLVVENRGRFRAGGFDIEYRPDKPPTKRLRLRSQPCSRRTVFVTDDLQELVVALKGGTMSSFALRPARVRNMLASRACRKSIMVGTPLNEPVMARVVRSLEGLDHPWSCPHGRPTMRHLVRIDR